jgi:hypothetical protein
VTLPLELRQKLSNDFLFLDKIDLDSNLADILPAFRESLPLLEEQNGFLIACTTDWILNGPQLLNERNHSRSWGIELSAGAWADGELQSLP